MRCIPTECRGLLLVLIWVAGHGSAAEPASDHWQIRRVGDAWQLLRDGEPFYVKGAVGWHDNQLLRACGANSIRTTANRRSLDRAQDAGLKALANLPVRGQRSNLDWGDEASVAAQQKKVLQVVTELKDHPAVALWAIGNELDWIPPGIPYHPQLWARLNDLAIAIHEIDPHHPVMTVVGTGRFEEKIQVIARECPDLDLLGINTYGDIAQVAGLARQHWPKPYVIAEWGPTGHWQVPKTRWRVPLEQTSAQKAEVTRQRYQDVILGDPDHCLGSFVFLWGQKQETTHTWYGMFLDGKRTESVDVMQFEWTGGWPANRVPQVRGLEIAGCPDPASTYLQPSQACTAEVACLDPDQDPLTFRWDIRPEVEIPKNSYAGGLEKPAQPVPDLIPDPTQRQIRFTAPARPGAYRLFVEVEDGQGHVGYANRPFYVQP